MQTDFRSTLTGEPTSPPLTLKTRKTPMPTTNMGKTRVTVPTDYLLSKLFVLKSRMSTTNRENNLVELNSP